MDPQSDSSMIPSDISVNEHSLDALYKYYPKDLFPKALKKPTGKARKCGFEHIENNIYESEANMVAFVTSSNRLPCWVRAAWLYVYDYIGTKGNMDVRWEHDPKDKHKLTSISIDVLTKKDKINPLAYKMTIFINTGTIQIQGNNYNLFVSSHFKILIALVNRLISVCDQPKSDGSVSEETIPKVYHDHDDQDRPATPSRIPIRLATARTPPSSEALSNAKLELKSDLQHLELNFSEALGKFSDSFAQQLQIELQKVTDKFDSLCSEIKSSSKMMVKEQSTDSAKVSKEIQTLNDTINKQNMEVMSLKNKVQVLTHENKSKQSEMDHKLQTVRSDYELEIAKLHSKLDTQTQLNSDVKQQLNQSTHHLNNNLEHLEQKLVAKNSEITNLEGICTNLRHDMEIKNNEILSLKMHASQSFQFNEKFDETNEKQQSRQTIPKVLLIGTSNTKGIDEKRLSAKFATEKCIAYTFKQTLEKLDSVQSDHYNAIVLHCLTNEIEKESPDTCVSKLDEIVKKCCDFWPNIKVIVSLATPRLDNLNVKVELTNALVKNKFQNVGNISICDNSNLSHRGTPQQKFLDHQRDNYHLNNSGVAQLSANMKSTICDALRIPMFRKYQLSSVKPKKGNQQNKNNRGFRQYRKQESR